MLSKATARQFKATLKSVYARVTRNRLTATFFLFGFFHCFAQGIIQSFLFDIDSQYANLLSDITTAAGVPKRNHTFLEGTEGDYRLRMCDWIPHLPGNCTTLSPVSDFDMDLELTAQQRGEVLRSLFDTLIVIRPPTGNFSGVVIVNKEQPGFDVSLTTQCTSILTFPAQDLRNNMREDLAFVFLQFWLFFIAILAMISDSVPHVVAGVVARTLLTAWSAYALWRTNSKKLIYDELIQTPGTTCSVDLFPIYFKTRTNYEIPDLVLNVTALYIACHLSWTLFRDYSKQSFKTVGAPLHIIKMYKFYLAVQACLQLEVYILVVSMSLWIDQLINTYIGAISQHTWVYIGVFVFFNALVLPWLMLGWYAIRREHKLLMALFIFTAFLFFFTESIMFYADTYRWTFVSWANLACFTVASMILIGSSFILGIICMLNFNKGLAQYLHAESTLESINFAPEVFEHDITKHHIMLVQSAGPQPNKLKKGYRLTNSALSSPKEKTSPYCMVMDDWIR